MRLEDLRQILNEAPDGNMYPPIGPGNTLPPPPSWWTGTLWDWYQWAMGSGQYGDAVPPYPPMATPDGPLELYPDNRPFDPIEMPNAPGQGPGGYDFDDSVYSHRPWHPVLDDNGNWTGEWEYDPTREGGYSGGERRRLREMGYEPGDALPAPNWNPDSPGSGPGQWTTNPKPNNGPNNPVFVPPSKGGGGGQMPGDFGFDPNNPPPPPPPGSTPSWHGSPIRNLYPNDPSWWDDAVQAAKRWWRSDVSNNGAPPSWPPAGGGGGGGSQPPVAM